MIKELTYRLKALGQCLRLKTLKLRRKAKDHDQRRFESKGIRESFTETRVLFQINREAGQKKSLPS